jgi:glutaredoxin 2
LSLRKETTFPEDHPSIIGLVRPNRFKILDATLGPSAYRLTIKEICERYDVAEARLMVNEIVDEIATERQRQEAQQKQIHAENEARRKLEDTSLSRFIRALRNHSLFELDTWLQKETSENKVIAFNEYKILAARRGLTLSQEDAAWGMNFLYANLKRKQESLLSKIKERIGVP